QGEREGGPEVHHELEFGGLLEGEVSRLCPLQDLVHEGRGASKVVAQVGAIAHEPADLDVFPLREHRGQVTVRRQLRDPRAVGPEDRVTEDEEGLCAVADHRREGTVVVVEAICRYALKPQPQRAVALRLWRLAPGARGVTS